MDSFMKRISNAQNELKAPKNQFNKFGGYKYRSCEDILESAKPICNKYSLVLTVSDEIQIVGDRYYIKSTATIHDTETDAKISNTAYARESETKKGMDESQITGTASSYARKYALNGLFCIDDTKDADTDEFANQQKKDEKKTVQKSDEKKPVQKTAKAETQVYICKICGRDVTDYRKADGTLIPAQQVFNGCGEMCLSCFNQKKKENA